MKPNLPIAFASLLLSIMLWFVVYAQNVPDPQAINAPLALDSLDDAHFFLKKVPTDVRLVVNAPTDRVKDLGEERVTASVDLSNPKVGLHDYPVTVSPDWVRRYLDDSHPTVRIEIEPMDSRTVKVTSVLKGSLRDRTLQLVDRHYSPTQVVVRGPASEIQSVAAVRAYLDLSEINPLHVETQESELVPVDGRGLRPQHVRTIPQYAENYFELVPAEATKPAEIVPDLDITYDGSVLPDGWRTDPRDVTISGRPAVLANVSKVPTGIVRARDLDRTRTFKVRLIPPAGTKILEPLDVDVTVLTRPAPKPRLKKSVDATTTDASRTSHSGSPTNAPQNR